MKKMCVAPLQLVSDRGVIADEIASLDQEIEKIEQPGTSLEELVFGNGCHKGLVQQRRQVGITRSDKGIQIGLGLISAREDLIAREIAKCRS